MQKLPPLLRADRQNLSPKLRSGDVFSAVSHSAQALVTRLSDLLSVIATHRQTHRGHTGAATRTSVSFRTCSFSLHEKEMFNFPPTKWTARVLQKACEMADLVGAWIPSSGCPVSSKQKHGPRRNAPGFSVSTFSACGR